MATACVPGGWPPDAAPDAASAGSDADAGCPPTSCDWMTGDLGGAYFPMCGEGGTGWIASSIPHFWLMDSHSILGVRLGFAFETPLPAGEYDAGDLEAETVLWLFDVENPQILVASIAAVDTVGNVTIADTFARIELTAYFEDGAITGCIDGDPFW